MTGVVVLEPAHWQHGKSRVTEEDGVHYLCF